MASKFNYADYVALHQDNNIRKRFNNQQWVALNKLVRGRQLSVEDKRALCAADIIDKQGEITLSGRVCVNKVNKKRQLDKSKQQVSRSKLAWEMEND